MEKVLPYDRTIVRQETSWWCGPASVQVVLNSIGIHRTEHSLMLELEKLEGNHGFDDRDGTDHIRQITQVLNDHTSAGYFTVDMPNDPPKAEQKDRLWRDLVASINGGRGVIVNIVAPPSNYPKHVAPSTISPAYGGGTVYHYMTVMGYSDDGPRRVRIADSGFTPYGYWMSFDQLATLIPPKGYSAAPGPAEPAPAPVPATTGLTAENLAAAMGNVVSLDRYRELLPAFAEAMRQAECTTALRAAMWCAQLGHESEGLQWFEEQNWSGGKQTDAQYFARYDTHPNLGNGPGDGLRYKGRGPIQVTGRHNYGELSRWAHGRGLVPSPTFFVDQPELLASPQYGFLGAVWYWTAARPQINALADRQDLDAVTRLINGGLNGIADRKTRYARCLTIGEGLVPHRKDASVAIDTEGRAAFSWLGNRTAQGDAADGGRYAHHEGGSIYWHPATGAYAIPTAVLEKYEQLGWEHSYLGYPTGRHTVLTDPATGAPWGDVQGFQGGAIYRRYGEPGHVVTGMIRAYWDSTGFESGSFGWPISDEQWADRDGGVRFQDFERGRITWSANGLVGTHAEPGFDSITTQEN